MVKMVLNVPRNHKAYQGGEEGEKGVQSWRKRGIIYLSLHSHPQNDACITMVSDESHFNVSLIVRDKVTRLCPQTTALLKRERSAEAESNRGPSAYQPNGLPLGKRAHSTCFYRPSIWLLVID